MNGFLFVIEVEVEVEVVRILRSPSLLTSPTMAMTGIVE